MKNIQLMLIPLLLVIFSFKTTNIHQEPSIVGLWTTQKKLEEKQMVISFIR
jgi:hypothetical protein